MQAPPVSPILSHNSIKIKEDFRLKNDDADLKEVVKMKITIDNIDYTISESDKKWTLSNVCGKTTTSLIISKSEAPSLNDLVEYVRCIKSE